MVAGRLANLPAHRPAEGGQLAGLSQPDAAAMLNVGERTVRRAREVLTEGSHELVSAVEQGYCC